MIRRGRRAGCWWRCSEGVSGAACQGVVKGGDLPRTVALDGRCRGECSADVLNAILGVVCTGCDMSDCNVRSEESNGNRLHGDAAAALVEGGKQVLVITDDFASALKPFACNDDKVSVFGEEVAEARHAWLIPYRGETGEDAFDCRGVLVVRCQC